MGVVDGGFAGNVVAAGATVDLQVADFGTADAPTELGVLLLYRGGAPEGSEAEAILID